MLRKSTWILTGILLFSVGLAVTPLRAQNAQGTILGHIDDPTGGAVPNAKVSLLNEGTGISVVFTTGAPGDYVFVKQIPGIYDVTVEAHGFKVATTKGLSLHVDQTLRQDFTLEVGTITQEITVAATASMLQSDSTTIGGTVNERAMETLPLNGRDYTTLIAINAGVNQPQGGIQASVFDLHGLNPNWSESSVNGARPASIGYLVDGITDNEQFFDKSISLVSADAIQEFKLQNGMYSPEYGAGSAQVNVAIKSGTNTLHGTAYDYWRNVGLQPASEITRALNEINGTHNPVSSPFNQNQFGATAGGPLRLPKIYNGRDKTFWFFAYEGGREVSGGTAPSFANVPTALERTGNFSEWPYPIYDPATTGSVPATPTDPTGRTQFPGNIMPSSRFSSIAQKWLSYYPAPNVSCSPLAQCNNLEGILRSTTVTDTVNGRVDHRLSDRDRLIGTVIVSRDVPYSPSLLPASATLDYTRTRMVGFEYDHNFSGNSINTFRAGYNRENYHNGAITSFGPNLSSQLGFANTTTNAAFYGLPGLSLTNGYSAPGNGNNGYTEWDNIFQYVDNYTLIRGKHTFTMGTDIRRLQTIDYDGFNVNGVLDFTGAYTASNPAVAGVTGPNGGNALADFLLGYPVAVGSPPVPVASDIMDLRSTYYDFFFQDAWRLTPRLTFTYGIRYEFPEANHSRGNDGSQLNEATPGGGLIWASKAFTTPLASAPSASTYYQCCVSNELVPTDRRDWAPRIGLAWRPLPNNDKLVLRAGYGIFYDTWMRFYDDENYDANSLSLLYPPAYPRGTGNESASPLALNTLWYAPIVLEPTSVPPAYEFGIETEWPANRTPYNQQWTFDVQYQFTNSLMLDVGYVGLHGVREPYQWHFNEAYPPTVTGDLCNGTVDRSLASAACLSDPNFQPVDVRTTNFPNFAANSYANSTNLWSNYNALQVRLNKRFTQGLQFGVNYTWSRTFDLGSEIAALGGEENLVQNGNNLGGEYGPASYDIPQRLVLNYLYDVPVGKGRKWNLGLANWLLGGWQTSGILTFSSGTPFTVYCCPRSSNVNQMGTGFGDVFRADLVGNPHAVSQTDLTWFNPSAFATPAIGRFGDSTRGILRGTAIHGGDISFMKNFKVTERHNFQYRVDIFNALSSEHYVAHLPDDRVSDSPVNCAPGPIGTCHFGSLVGLNGLGDLNLWNPRTLQMSLRYVF
jgi:hypothetical protein